MPDFSLQSPVGSRVMIAGRQRDYFSGTGYLGLQSHPRVLQAAVEALQRYGLSTATSRGGYGEHSIYDELESQLRQEVEELFQLAREDAMTMGTDYRWK